MVGDRGYEYISLVGSLSAEVDGMPLISPEGLDLVGVFASFTGLDEDLGGIGLLACALGVLEERSLGVDRDLSLGVE